MSVYGISVSSLLAQGSKINDIARDIANVNSVPDFNAVPTDTISISQPNDDSLANNAVDFITAKTAFQADIKVIKAQDEMDKSLLDIIT